MQIWKASESGKSSRKKTRIRVDLAVRFSANVHLFVFQNHSDLHLPVCRQTHADSGCAKELIQTYSCAELVALLRKYTYTKYRADGTTQSVKLPTSTPGIRKFVLDLVRVEPAHPTTHACLLPSHAPIQIAGIAAGTMAAVDIEHKKLKKGM